MRQNSQILKSMCQILACDITLPSSELVVLPITKVLTAKNVVKIFHDLV